MRWGGKYPKLLLLTFVKERDGVVVQAEAGSKKVGLSPLFFGRYRYIYINIYLGRSIDRYIDIWALEERKNFQWHKALKRSRHGFKAQRERDEHSELEEPLSSLV